MRYLFAFWILLLLLAGPAFADGMRADLELVLAVDASGSVDEGEYRLQLQGIAAGFRDSAVREAIRSGPLARIAVSLVVWAEHQVPKDSSGWFLLETDADAENFARTVESFPRGQSGATGIGEGVAAALREIEANGIKAMRQVVDVSGDGRETPARDYVVLMPQARSMAISRGVTINGLAILNEDPGLGLWYRQFVMTGPDSFVMAAARYEDFARAMRRKLLREIDWRPKLSDGRHLPWNLAQPGAL